MQELARRIAKVSQESKLPVVEDEYVQSFKVELMDAVIQWCRGASFADICKVVYSREHPWLVNSLIPCLFFPVDGSVRRQSHPRI